MENQNFVRFIVETQDKRVQDVHAVGADDSKIIRGAPENHTENRRQKTIQETDVTNARQAF